MGIQKQSEKMELSRLSKSAKSLANKRRHVKGKIQRLQAKLTEFEGSQELPSIPEIRVFAKNIATFYAEFDRVLQLEESDHSADERDAHDLECAEIDGLLQGANQKIVALSCALLSQPVPASVQEQFQVQPLAVSPQDAKPIPLSTSEGRGESACTEDGDVPEETSPQIGEPVDSAEVNAKVCAQPQPPIATTELNADCFTHGEVLVVQSQVELQETNPSLSSLESIPLSPHRSESPFEMHHAMQTPTESDAVYLESPSETRRDTDESVGPNAVPMQRTEEPADSELNVGRCQSVEIGSLLPADAERDDADSDDPEAVPNPETAELFDDEPDIVTNQAVIEDQACSLQPTGSKDWSLPSGALPVGTAPSDQEDSAKNVNEVPTTKNPDFSVTRSDTDRVTEARSAVEKLPEPAISSSTERKSRLVWDPGVWQNVNPFQSIHRLRTPPDGGKYQPRLAHLAAFTPEPPTNRQSVENPKAVSLPAGLMLEAEPSTRGENVRP